MEYRGKQFTVVQGINPDSWKWSVHLDEATIRTGEAKTRPKAMADAVIAIDHWLKPRKVKLAPPDQTGA